MQFLLQKRSFLEQAKKPRNLISDCILKSRGKGESTFDFEFPPSTKEEVEQVYSFIFLPRTKRIVSALQKLGFKKSTFYFFTKEQYVTVLNQSIGEEFYTRIHSVIPSKGNILNHEPKTGTLAIVEPKMSTTAIAAQNVIVQPEQNIPVNENDLPKEKVLVFGYKVSERVFNMFEKSFEKNSRDSNQQE